MEALADVAALVATFIGGGGFFAALLSYQRGKRKDTMDAYADLYAKVEARCDALEKKVTERDGEIAALRKQVEERDGKIRALTLRVAGLERELAQVGNSAAYLLNKGKAGDK